MLADAATDTLFGIIGTVVAINIAVAVAVVRILSQISKINEWIRIYERKNGQNH